MTMSASYCVFVTANFYAITAPPALSFVPSSVVRAVAVAVGVAPRTKGAGLVVDAAFLGLFLVQVFVVDDRGGPPDRGLVRGEGRRRLVDGHRGWCGGG